MSVPLPPGQDPNEIFDVVDSSDQVIARATRAEVHASGAFHRAVHVLLYNAQNDLFLQRRSDAKDMFPGCWDSSCSGHLAAGEDYPTAARRELREELGVADPALTLRPLLKMSASPGTSQEFIQVFIAGPYEGPFRPNPAEIVEAQFVTIPDLDRYVREQPHGFAGGFRTLWTQHRDEILRAISAAFRPSGPTLSVPIEVVSSPRRSNQTASFKRYGVGLAGVGLFLLKYGVFFLKFAKPLLSAGFMLVIYTSLYGWKFALGIVFLLFVHELGHVVAAKLLGIRTSSFIFIPFFGAMTTLEEYPQNAWTAALFALGGPILGGLGAGLVLGIGIVFDVPWLIATGVFGFGFNLFNLVPVPPFDGGTICAAVSPWFWFIGLFVLGGVMWYFHSISWLFLIFIFALFGIPRFMHAFSGNDPEARLYYQTRWPRRLLMAVIYLAVIGGLLGALFLAIPYLPPTDGL